MLKILYKDGCMPCQRLKTALMKLNIQHETIHVGSLEGEELVSILRMTVEKPTVPAVFKNGYYLGDSTIKVIDMAGIVNV